MLLNYLSLFGKEHFGFLKSSKKKARAVELIFLEESCDFEEEVKI